MKFAPICLFLRDRTTRVFDAGTVGTLRCSPRWHRKPVISRLANIPRATTRPRSHATNASTRMSFARPTSTLARRTTLLFRAGCRRLESTSSDSGATISRDLKARDHAAEAAYFHEKDLEALRRLTRKVKHAHAVQTGVSMASREVEALKTLVPETKTLSEDAIARLLDWKHTH